MLQKQGLSYSLLLNGREEGNLKKSATKTVDATNNFGFFFLEEQAKYAQTEANLEKTSSPGFLKHIAFDT